MSMTGKTLYRIEENCINGEVLFDNKLFFTKDDAEDAIQDLFEYESEYELKRDQFIIVETDGFSN